MRLSISDQFHPVRATVTYIPKTDEDPEDFDLWVMRITEDGGELSIYFRDPVRLRTVVKELYEQVLKLEV